ncbi:hypothetical protein PM082_004566 [Marasmius tenuissimus]|nr:hypothetical protein PM082_004566 [Marasmius tenuissimus]
MHPVDSNVIPPVDSAGPVDIDANTLVDGENHDVRPARKRPRSTTPDSVTVAKPPTKRSRSSNVFSASLGYSGSPDCIEKRSDETLPPPPRRYSTRLATRIPVGSKYRYIYNSNHPHISRQVHPRTFPPLQVPQFTAILVVSSLLAILKSVPTSAVPVPLAIHARHPQVATGITERRDSVAPNVSPIFQSPNQLTTVSNESMVPPDIPLAAQSASQQSVPLAHHQQDAQALLGNNLSAEPLRGYKRARSDSLGASASSIVSPLPKRRRPNPLEGHQRIEETKLQLPPRGQDKFQSLGSPSASAIPCPSVMDSGSALPEDVRLSAVIEPPHVSPEACPTSPHPRIPDDEDVDAGATNQPSTPTNHPGSDSDIMISDVSLAYQWSSQDDYHFESDSFESSSGVSQIVEPIIQVSMPPHSPAEAETLPPSEELQHSAELQVAPDNDIPCCFSPHPSDISASAIPHPSVMDSGSALPEDVRLSAVIEPPHVTLGNLPNLTSSSDSRRRGRGLGRNKPTF